MSKNRQCHRSIRILISLLFLGTAQCNHGRCEEMRDKLSGLKDAWQACQKDDDCVIVGGSSKDCTGILSCDFAVNRLYRSEADRVVASLPEETVDCIECSPPNCVGGEVARCDNVTWRCTTEVIASNSDASSTDMTNHGIRNPANSGPSQQ